jgi:uncharacterized protein CbrC (UPF0167 family)/ankyrin repeat protein
MPNNLFDCFKQLPKDEAKLQAIFQEFINQSVSVDIADATGDLPLHHACEQGHSNLALLLINHSTEIDRQNNLGITPLHYAAANGLMDVCRALLNKGADVNKKTTDGLSPLYLAIEYSTEEIAAYFVSSGADLLLPLSDYDRTILHIAAIKGYQQLCTIILDKGIPVDLTDAQGYTALQLAVRENHPRVIEYLASRGASLMHVNESGLAARGIASNKIHLLRLLQKLGDPYITDDWFPKKIHLPLPIFRYHPDPITTGSVIYDENFVCNCCNKLAGYCIEITDVSVCPWCLASGKAYRKFKKELAAHKCDFETKLPSAVQEEVRQRTPKFYGWQEEQWLTCCNDACAYLGSGGIKELSTFGEKAILSIKQAIITEGFCDFVNADRYLSLLGHGTTCAHLFQCLSCAQFKTYIDPD